MNKQPVILMYHGVITEWTALPEGREAGAELYAVTTTGFQDHLQWLKDNDYVVTTQYAPASNKNIVLTFDDGEMNNYDHALPLLRKYGFPAYFFLIAGRVGRPGYMGWDEIKAMRDAGMVIGSHGFSHEILTRLLDTQIEEELCASKRYLERNLGVPVDTVSIPRGFCNDKVIQMAYDAGYRAIFISQRPKNLRPDCFSRTAVKGNWTLKRFKQALDDKAPFNERAFVLCRDGIKKVFGDGMYDWVRKMLLR